MEGATSPAKFRSSLHKFQHLIQIQCNYKNHALPTCNYPLYCCQSFITSLNGIGLGQLFFFSLVFKSLRLLVLQQNKSQNSHRSTHTHTQTHVHTILYLQVNQSDSYHHRCDRMFICEGNVAFIKCLPLRHRRPPNCCLRHTAISTQFIPGRHSVYSTVCCMSTMPGRPAYFTQLIRPLLYNVQSH